MTTGNKPPNYGPFVGTRITPELHDRIEVLRANWTPPLSRSAMMRLAIEKGMDRLEAMANRDD